MQQRTTVIELFSTFIQFADDRFARWVSARHLQASLEQQFTDEHKAVQPEGFWVLYWYKCWQAQSHPWAIAHLQAYLQEPCYRATAKIAQRFATVSWTLADGFQTAIAQAERILQGYRPDYGSPLSAYAQTAFGNLIRDHLRQQQEISICSDWGLLRRLSQAQLQRSLQASGYPKPEQHILVWQCFQAVYAPSPQQTVRTLAAPDFTQFTAMTARYDQLRREHHPHLPTLNVDGFMACLDQAVQAVRAYQAPTVTSLDQPQSAQTQQTRLEQLTKRTQADGSGDQHTPMEQLVAAEVYAEQQQRQQQIATVLTQAIATLSLTEQTLLQLYYQDGLTQAAIAAQLQIKQYQVSRNLGRIRQRLLLAVAQWSEAVLHIRIDATVLNNMSNVIHEWLQHHYQSEAEERHELGV